MDIDQPPCAIPSSLLLPPTESRQISFALSTPKLVSKRKTLIQQKFSSSSSSEEEQTEITVFNDQRLEKKKADFLLVDVVFSTNPADESKPLLLRHRLQGLDEIEDEQDRYRFDVASRPAEPTLQNYKNIPCEQFGEGYLRAYGWAPGDPVGKSNKGVVPIIEFCQRAHRMGLGAKAKSESDQPPPSHAPKNKSKPDSELKEQPISKRRKVFDAPNETGNPKRVLRTDNTDSFQRSVRT